MQEHDGKPHIHVTAALIWDEGRLLISRRPKGTHLAGFWEFPGGKQEKGESLEACLEREIMEELGLRIKARKVILTVEHEYDSRVVSLHFFKCTALPGKATPLESQEIKWVEPSELCRFTFPPADKKVVECLTGQMPSSRRKGAWPRLRA